MNMPNSIIWINGMVNLMVNIPNDARKMIINRIVYPKKDRNMKDKAELLKEAKQRATDEFNNLPFEIRKKLANGYDRLIEVTALIQKGDKLNMAALKERRVNLERWLLEWYEEIKNAKKQQ